jgi:hypothetical protein
MVETMTTAAEESKKSNKTKKKTTKGVAAPTSALAVPETTTQQVQAQQLATNNGNSSGASEESVSDAAKELIIHVSLSQLFEDLEKNEVAGLASLKSLKALFYLPCTRDYIFNIYKEPVELTQGGSRKARLKLLEEHIRPALLAAESEALAKAAKTKKKTLGRILWEQPNTFAGLNQLLTANGYAELKVATTKSRQLADITGTRATATPQYSPKLAMSLLAEQYQSLLNICIEEERLDVNHLANTNSNATDAGTPINSSCSSNLEQPLLDRASENNITTASNRAMALSDKALEQVHTGDIEAAQVSLAQTLIAVNEIEDIILKSRALDKLTQLQIKFGVVIWQQLMQPIIEQAHVGSTNDLTLLYTREPEDKDHILIDSVDSVGDELRRFLTAARKFSDVTIPPAAAESSNNKQVIAIEITGQTD